MQDAGIDVSGASAEVVALRAMGQTVMYVGVDSRLGGAPRAR